MASDVAARMLLGGDVSRVASNWAVMLASGSTANLKGYTVGSRAPKVSVSSGTKTTGYATNGSLRGVDKNKQNVPTAAVLLVPVAASLVYQFLGKTWGF